MTQYSVHPLDMCCNICWSSFDIVRFAVFIQCSAFALEIVVDAKKEAFAKRFERSTPGCDPWSHIFFALWFTAKAIQGYVPTKTIACNIWTRPGCYSIIQLHITKSGRSIFLRLTQLWMTWLHRSEARRQYARTHTINTDSGAFTARCQQHARACMQRQSKAIHQHSQICLQWHHWIVFLMLFISIAPHFCSGAWTSSHI